MDSRLGGYRRNRQRMSKLHVGLGRLWIVTAALLALFTAQGQNGTNLWEAVEQVPPGKGPDEIWVHPQVFRTFNLSHAVLRGLARQAPKEGASGARGTAGPAA